MFDKWRLLTLLNKRIKPETHQDTITEILEVF